MLSIHDLPFSRLDLFFLSSLRIFLLRIHRNHDSERNLFEFFRNLKIFVLCNQESRKCVTVHICNEFYFEQFFRQFPEFLFKFRRQVCRRLYLVIWCCDLCIFSSLNFGFCEVFFSFQNHQIGRLSCSCHSNNNPLSVVVLADAVSHSDTPFRDPLYLKFPWGVFSESWRGCD